MAWSSGHVLHQLVVGTRRKRFVVWLICFSSVIQWCSFGQEVHQAPTARKKISIPSNPLQLTNSWTWKDPRKYFQEYWQVESWWKLMLFMKQITFSASTLRYPNIDIDDVLDYNFRKVFEILHWWNFKVTTFQHCNNSVISLIFLRSLKFGIYTL